MHSCGKPALRGTLVAPMRRLAIAAAMLPGGSGACELDTTGQGTGSGAIVASDTDHAEPTTGGATPSPEPDTGAADGTGGSSDGEGPSPDDGDMDDTTGAMSESCENPEPVTIDMSVEEATIVSPMRRTTLPGYWSYAFSEETALGRASFEFQVPCPGEFRVFAFVYDSGVGLDAGTVGDPDAYRVAIDDDTPVDWFYGCQTIDDGVNGHVWTWLPVVSHGLFCKDEDYSRTLSPGVHLLHLTNREAGDHQSSDGTTTYVGDVAAVSRVVITSDPNYSPPS